MIIVVCHIQLSFLQEILHNITYIICNKFLTGMLTGAQEPVNYVRLETSHYALLSLSPSLIHVLHFTFFFFQRIDGLICHGQQQSSHISR